MNNYKSQPVPVTNELAPNSIVESKGYHLSYCSRVSDYGCVTTALVLRNNVFLILKGDHRKTWPKEPLQASFDYFVENRDQWHDFSDVGNIFNPQTRWPSIRRDFIDMLGEENLAKLGQSNDLSRHIFGDY